MRSAFLKRTSAWLPTVLVLAVVLLAGATAHHAEPRAACGRGAHRCAHVP